MFALQRFSGIVTFIYLHAFMVKLQFKNTFGKAVDFELMHKTLENPIWVIVYIVCVLCVIFHFSNGLWSFFVTWGFYNLNNHNVYSLGSL